MIAKPVADLLVRDANAKTPAVCHFTSAQFACIAHSCVQIHKDTHTED